MFNEFMVQYDKVVVARHEAEEKEDFQTMKIHASLSGSHPIERVTGARYTWHFFRKFQMEFVASNK